MTRQSRPGHQSGFTIIEVMLFLAITGLLFLIGFFGTGAQVRNVRFTDSMRGLESYLQKQYGLVTTGSNPREKSYQCSDPGTIGQPPQFSSGTASAGDTAGDEIGCVLLGKLVKFDTGSSTVTTYYVAGQHLSDQELTGDDVQDIKNSGPALSPQAAETYSINWGTVFNQPSTAGASNQTQSFAYLRSPSSGRILTFAFSNNSVTESTAPGNDAGFRSAIATGTLAKNAGYCFKNNDGRNALMQVGHDQRSEAIDLILRDFDQNADCVRSKP